MSERVGQLRKMVEALPDLSQLVNHEGNQTIEYIMPGQGTALGFSLWNRENIAVQRVFLTTDTEFPPHTHQEHEYIILISGSMRMIGDGIIVGPHRERVIEVGGGCYFMPLHPHGFEVLEDSWVLGVTIPASEAYPGGK